MTTWLQKLSPFLSALIKASISSDGGESKFTSSSCKLQPFLATALTHLFASRNTCFTVVWGILFGNNLQSNNKDEYAALEEFLELIKSKTTFASSSTSRICTPSCTAICRPSLRAQNLAIMLVLDPILLANPLTHYPALPLKTPPPLALPGLPHEAPFVFNLNQLEGGFSQCTVMTAIVLCLLSFPTQ